MKKYSAYKDSGIDWIGEIPEDWKVTKIKYNTYVKGRIGWQGLKSDEFIDEGAYLVTGTDLINGKVNWDTCYHISEERYNEAPQIQLKNDDLLITKDGTIGKLAIVNDLPYKAILNSGLFITRPLDKSYTSEYLFWVLSSDVFWRYFKFFEAGSTIKHLYQETFVNFSFPLPNDYKQLSIINYLRTKVGLIDKVLDNKVKLTELLKEKRQAIITQVIINGLNDKVIKKDSGIGWIGDIPESVTITKLKYFTTVKDGTHDTPQYMNFGEDSVPLVTSKDIKEGLISFENTKYISVEDHLLISKRSNVEMYNVIMPMIGTVGNPAIVLTDKQFSIKNVALFKTNNLVEAKFLKYYLNSTIVKMQFDLSNRGGVQQFVSLDILKNIVFLKHRCIEAIVEHLDKNTSFIDSVIEDIYIQIEKLKEYRQSIISEAVTGKVVV